MRAVILTGYGSADMLELRTVPRPTPGAGQVLVRVRATGVNDWDWGIVTGASLLTRLFEGLLRPKKRILGLDVAGEVIETGPGVTKFAPGDRVYGDLSSAGFGGFAEYVAADEHAFSGMPADMPFVDAAAIPHAANLALQAIALAKLEPHHSLLINGAAGGVGTLAAQIAASLGVRNIVGVDAASKLEFLREEGFARALDYRAVDFTRMGEQFDVVIDARSTRSPFAYARALNDGGSYVTVGGRTRRLLGIVIWRGLIRRRSGKQISVVALKTNRDTDAASALYTAGTLRPRIDSVWSLAETPQAMAKFGRAEHRGKIVVSGD
jgi:NADPH:quinone reductase-like Zn-dependent oxidoreductase